ncbi:MAG: T9SS sorting signal type C domain-containing protein [Bacteroidota bacterium]
MKTLKTFSLIFIGIFTTQLINAQYCGLSGPSVCTPTGLMTQPGLSPASDNLTPFTNGVVASTVIQFKNWDTIIFAGQKLTFQSLKIDSIQNLPAGLCWATNKTNNTYGNQEDGCITISGLTCAVPGQYRLRIIVTANVGFTLNKISAAAMGLYYYVRVKNNGDADIAVDTTGQSNNSTPAFQAYGTGANCSGAVSVNLGSNQTVCNNASVTLSPTISGGTQPYTFSWSSTGNSLSCSNCQNPTATITQNSTFTVTITDANNNTATDAISYTVAGSSFQISANGPVTFCQGGSVTLNAGSGYLNYHWSNNSSGSTLVVNQSGTYFVTVTNTAGCTFADSEVVTVNTPSISNYQITASGPTTFCNGGSVTLNAGSGFTSYIWNNSSSMQTITVSQTGNYTVTVLGVDGCTYTDNQSVNTNASFSGQELCIVSVDPISGKNVLIWEKSGGFGIDSFKVYRETNIANTYQLIRKQVFGNLSTYEDGQSNPQQQSNRYVMTTVDGCGESSYSAAHQTIHLTSNVGINNEVNLIWNAYVGFSYPSFNIYRGSSSGNLQQIASVSSATFSYTDLTPPAPPLFYQIEVVNPNGCVPTAKNLDYSSSLSNVIQLNTVSIQEKTPDVVSVFHYYNESSEENIVHINYSKQPMGTLTLYDVSGRLVFELDKINTTEVYLPSNLSKGIYIVQVKTENSQGRSKIYLR